MSATTRRFTNTTNAEPAVEVENLTMRFGDFCAVDNVTFSMNKNEAVGIIGPNGAGKTTFVSLLSGQFPPHLRYYQALRQGRHPQHHRKQGG